jgi:hypothetical protein
VKLIKIQVRADDVIHVNPEAIDYISVRPAGRKGDEDVWRMELHLRSGIIGIQDVPGKVVDQIMTTIKEA